MRFFHVFVISLTSASATYIVLDGLFSRAMKREQQKLFAKTVELDRYKNGAIP